MAAAAGFQLRAQRCHLRLPRGDLHAETRAFDTSKLAFEGVFFASVSFSPLEKEMKSRPGQGLTAVERNSKDKKSEEVKPSRATGRSLHCSKGSTPRINERERTQLSVSRKNQTLSRPVPTRSPNRKDPKQCERKKRCERKTARPIKNGAMPFRTPHRYAPLAAA